MFEALWLLSVPTAAWLMRSKGRSLWAGVALGALVSFVGVAIAALLPQKSGVTKLDSGLRARGRIGKSHQSGESSVRTFNNVLHVSTKSFSFQPVVGESNYSSALRAIARANGGSGTAYTQAILVPEPENPYDPKAIAVYMSGYKVGYIPREDTESVRQILQVAKEGEYISVNADLWCQDVDAKDLYASVKLELPADPAFAFPVNNVPEGMLLWPTGGRLQLSGEAEHLTDIGQLLSKARVPGACSAFITLRAVENPPSKWKVEAGVGPLVLGDLSPASSSKFGPLIHRLPGGMCAAYVEIRGNSLAAEIVVDVKNPDKLSREEIQALGL